MNFNSENEFYSWCQKKYISAMLFWSAKNFADSEKELLEMDELISRADTNILSNKVVVIQCSAYNQLKKIYKRHNNSEKLKECCQKYAEVLEKFSNFHKSDIPRLQRENYIDLLSIQLQESDESGSQVTFNKLLCLDHIRSFQGGVEVIYKYFQQGKVSFDEDDITRAIIYNNLSIYKAQILRSEFGNDNYKQLDCINREVHFNLGLCYKQQKEYEHAARYFYISFQLFKITAITDDNIRAINQITNELSNLYSENIKDSTKSIAFYNEAIKYYANLTKSHRYNKFGNEKIGVFYKLLGDEYTKSDQIEKAITCYNNTYNFSKFLNKSIVDESNQNIVALLYRQLESVKELKLSRYFSGVEYKNIHDKLGNIYTRLDKHKEAVNCYKISLMYAETLKDSGNAQGADLEIINLCHKICVAHKELGSHPSEAAIYIKKINNCVQGYYDIIRKHIRSAELCYNKNYKQDLDKADEALNVLRKIPPQYVESGCIEGIETSIAEVIMQKQMGLSYYFGGMDSSARVDDADISESGGDAPDDKMDCS